MDPVAQASEAAGKYMKLSKALRDSGYSHPQADKMKAKMLELQKELAELGFDGVHDPRLEPPLDI